MSLATTQEPAHASSLSHHAAQFLEQHQAEHLDNDQLVKRCCAYLMATTGISNTTASHITMHALAELQGRHLPAYFDVNHSTSLVVRVVDPRTGLIYQLTASDILQVAQAQNDAPPDPAHGIHLCGRRAAG